MVDAAIVQHCADLGWHPAIVEDSSPEPGFV